MGIQKYIPLQHFLQKKQKTVAPEFYLVTLIQPYEHLLDTQ
jgi:hypothetical protein